MEPVERLVVSVLVAVLASAAISGAVNYECYQNICLKIGSENGTYCLLNATCNAVSECESIECKSDYSKETKFLIDKQYAEEIVSNIGDLFNLIEQMLDSSNPGDALTVEQLIYALLGENVDGLSGDVIGANSTSSPH